MRNHKGYGHSRRTVLRASVAAAAAVATGAAVVGCDAFTGDPQPAPPPDPLTPLLAGVVELIARYDNALAAHPELSARLTPIRQAHQRHAIELAALIGTPVPGTPSAEGSTPTDQGAAADAKGTLTALLTAEASGRAAAAEACMSAPVERAALIGSIAAARASHAEALR